MKKFFPLCLILIVALVWTVSIAGNLDKVPTANSSQQTEVDKSQNLDAVQADEMTPEKAARIRADKDARHEEILRSMAGEEDISSEIGIEDPSELTTNVGGPALPEFYPQATTIADLYMPDSERRMIELKADGIIDASERAEYEQLLAEATPAVEIPMPLNIVSESEPNDVCTDADPMACGDTVWCATQTTGQDDHDWFTFTLAADQNVIIETHPTNGACDPASSDTYLELWSGDCQVLIASDDDGGFGYFSLIAMPLTAGTYAIHEDNTVWGSDGSYHLSVTCCDAPPNDNCADVTPVALPGNTPLSLIHI